MKSVKKPWGKFEEFSKNEKTTVKILTILPGRELSLQYHNKRSEFWLVLSGSCLVTIGNKKINAREGDQFKIDKKVKHRIKGGTKTSTILEISKGEFDEQDIVRLEDKYGRI